jgi:hypothetical protein
LLLSFGLVRSGQPQRRKQACHVKQALPTLACAGTLFVAAEAQAAPFTVTSTDAGDNGPLARKHFALPANAAGGLVGLMSNMDSPGQATLTLKAGR